MPPQRPTISIVTPSYNQAQYIEATLRSVLEQDYPAHEYEVMDGGSTDATVQILREYQVRYPQLHFVSGRDGGQSAALRTGFAKTSGEVIAWINSDDFYAPGAFQMVAQYFAEHPETQWLYGRCPIVDRHGRMGLRSWVTSYKNFWMRHYSFNWYLIENFVCQPAVFFRRSLYEQVGGLDPAYHCAMDYDLFLRMAAVSKPAFIDEDLAYFRISGDNKTSQLYRRSFAESLEAAKKVMQGKRPLLLAAHRLNRLKLVGAYWLLDALGA